MIELCGSTVVHSVGGWAACDLRHPDRASCRQYSKEGKANAIPGHSITLGALGVFKSLVRLVRIQSRKHPAGTTPDIALIAVIPTWSCSLRRNHSHADYLD
jgi:Amt family ammonium transporter